MAEDIKKILKEEISDKKFDTTNQANYFSLYDEKARKELEVKGKEVISGLMNQIK